MKRPFLLAATSLTLARSFVPNFLPVRMLGTSSTNHRMTAVKEVDPEYPGTAVERMKNVRARVAELAQSNGLNGHWEDVRRKLLWAGGLRDLPNAVSF